VREPFRCHRVCAVEFFVTNVHGNSPVETGNYTTGSLDKGLRVLSGGTIEMVVEGIIGVESNAVPEVRLPLATSILDIYAAVDEAPTGSGISVQVKVDGDGYGDEATIADGTATPANTVSGRDLPAIAAETPIRLDVTGVGSTFPGRRLVIRIRL
jgi:hypothetical protein